MHKTCASHLLVNLCETVTLPFLLVGLIIQVLLYEENGDLTLYLPWVTRTEFLPTISIQYTAGKGRKFKKMDKGVISWLNAKFSWLKSRELHGREKGELAMRCWEAKGLLQCYHWSDGNDEIAPNVMFSTKGGTCHRSKNCNLTWTS